MENQEFAKPSTMASPITRLWTDNELRAERKTELWKNLILTGLGWLLLLGGGALSKDINASCIGGIMSLTGFYLGFARLVLPYLYPPLQTKIYSLPITNRRFAGRQGDWFRVVRCPHCDQPVKVNVGYLEFNCQHCGFAENWIRAGQDEPPKNIARGARCASCGEENDLSKQSIWFTCPNCSRRAELKGVL